MKELFAIFKDEKASEGSRKAGMQFIQNCCQIAKSIQATARNLLYMTFIQNGLIQVIDNALLDKDPAVRVAATDVLVALIDHDAAMMRTTIYRQINEKQKPLTHTLIELLLGEQDLGVKAQIADAMRAFRVRGEVGKACWRFLRRKLSRIPLYRYPWVVAAGASVQPSHYRLSSTPATAACGPAARA